MRSSPSLRRWLGGSLLSLLFLAQIIGAVVVHLDTTLARRILARWGSEYLSTELRGTVEIGSVEKLGVSGLWLRDVAVYDEQHRKVATLDRVHASSALPSALRRWIGNRAALTLVIESIRADGVHLRLHPDPIEHTPSLLAALEPDPRKPAKSAETQPTPYRIFLSNVEFGDVTVESTMPDFITDSARLRRASGQLLFTNAGVAVSLKRFSLDWAGPKAIPLHAFGNVEYRSPARVWGDVNATIGQIPFSAHLLYQDETLELTLDALRVEPVAARQLLAEWPLQLPTTLALRLHGPMRELGVSLDLASGMSRVEVVGTAKLGPTTSGEFVVQGHQLDLQALFGPRLPSKLDAAARVTLSMPDGQPYFSVDGVIQPGNVAGYPTPSVEVNGQFDTEGLTLSCRSKDPTWPIRAALILRNRELNVEAQLNGIGLARVVPGCESANCRGFGSIRGRAKIADGAITSSADISLKGFGVGATKLEQATATVKFNGPLQSPLEWNGEIHADISQLASPLVQLERVALRAQGTAQRLHLSVTGEQPGVTKLAFTGDVLPMQGPRLTAGALELTRGASTIALHAKALEYSSHSIVLDGLTLDGSAGHAEGSIGIEDNHVFAKFSAQSLDLAVVSDLLGLPARSLAGHSNVELDVDTRERPARGTARFEFERASVGLLTGISGAVEFAVLANRLTGNAVLASDLVEEIRGDVDVELAGPLTQPASYQQAKGLAAVDGSRIRLDRVGTMLGWVSDGFALGGSANVRLSAERADATSSMNLTLNAVANQLRLIVPYAKRRLRFENMELAVGAGYRSGDGRIQSDWVLSQQGSPKSTLTFTADIAREANWSDALTALREWHDVPFEALLSLPSQSLSELGGILGVPIGTGTADLKVALKGPLNDAHLVTELQGNNLLLDALSNTLAFDAQGTFEYTRRSGDARVLFAAGNQQQLWMQLNGFGTVTPCENGPLCIAEWDGRIETGLLGLPLEALPGLGRAGLSGQIRGVLSTNRSHGITQIDGILPIDNFLLSGHPLGQTLLNVHRDDAALVAEVKLIDGGAQLDCTARVPVDWRQLLPIRRVDAPVQFTAQASGYDAGVVAPLFDRYVSGLAGDLSGSVEATYLAPTDPDGQTAQVAIGGHLALQRGQATIRSLGLALSDVELQAQASSIGSRTTISVPQLTASVGAGTNNLSGSAVIELEALALKRLAARVARAQEVPLVVNSVTLATLSGAGDVEMTPQASGYAIAVEFDDLDVRLPRTNGRQVVGLTENPDIVVLQPLGPDAWRKAHSMSETEYQLRLSLGKRARVTRVDFSLPVTGSPELTVGKTLRPSGTVQLEPLGRLELFGKAFVIDRGRVVFDPEQPDNPRLDVTATWRGPTHLVTIHILGKRTEARLRLTSDPPLASESQVMALLLGGGTGDDSTASAGLGVGATLFNEVLSDTALSSLEVRTSSDARHANYTAAVPIRENLWFEATYQSPTSTNLPGTSAQHGFSGTVDYRFRRNWSVRTEVGTLGAGADLMWQYRY